MELHRPQCSFLPVVLWLLGTNMHISLVVSSKIHKEFFFSFPFPILCELWSSKHIFKYSSAESEIQFHSVQNELKLIYESTSKNAKGVDLSKR